MKDQEILLKVAQAWRLAFEDPPATVPSAVDKITWKLNSFHEESIPIHNWFWTFNKWRLLEHFFMARSSLWLDLMG